MTTTLDARNTTAVTDESPVAVQRPGFLRRTIDLAAKPAPKTVARDVAVHRPRVPVLVWALLIRSTSIVVLYVLLIGVLFWFIPALGSFIHLNSGLSRVGGDPNGTIVLFIAPFAFALVLLAVAVLRLNRGAWRVGTSIIDRIKASREAVGVEVSSADFPRGARLTKTTTKGTTNSKGKK